MKIWNDDGTPFMRTPFNYDVEEVSNETGLDCSDWPSMAVQDGAEDADINTIVNRFLKTGELPNRLEMPQSGDFTDATDYHTAQNLVIQAKDEFMKLPARIRSMFGNDPGAFMDFIYDESNADKIRELGLTKPIEAGKVQDVRVVNANETLGNSNGDGDAGSTPKVVPSGGK